MELFLIILGCVLVWLAVTVVKDLDAKAQQRRDDRIMVNYRKAEAARLHNWRLAEIDATVQTTLDGLDRIAAEAQGGIIEGSCHEIEGRR